MLYSFNNEVRLTVIFATALYLAAFIAYFGFLIFNVKKKKSIMEHFTFTCFYVYTVAVLGIAFFPFPYQSALLATDRPFQQPNNYIPFHDIYMITTHDTLHDVLKQLSGNIVLFVPFGIYMALIRSGKKFNTTVVVGLAGSLLIEICQFIFDRILNYNYRTADIDDVILNLVGFLVGYAVFKLLDRYYEISNVFLRQQASGHMK